MFKIAWIIVIIACAVLEAVTTAMVSLWFAVGGGAALILAFCNAPVWAQILAFVAVSLLCFLLFRKLWRQKLKGEHIPTNADRNIGKTVLVTERIDNLRETGEVKVNGQLWTAKSMDDDQPIEVGVRVTIVKIEGSKMYVAPQNAQPGEKRKGEIELCSE